MARGINRVILVGNVGQDPETRHTQSGSAIVNLSLATSESWTDKNTGQKQERVEWHRVVFFNKLAEIVSQYITKGSQLYVEGQLRTRKWQDQSGQDKYSTEIIASEMQMLGGRGDGGQGNGYAQQPQQPQQQQRPQQQPRQPQQRPQQQPQPAGFDDFDDDIPF